MKEYSREAEKVAKSRGRVSINVSCSLVVHQECLSEMQAGSDV